MENETCDLLESAKHLASEKGLNPDEVVCPTIEECDGRSCDFLPETIFVSDERPSPLDRFKIREDETNVIRQRVLWEDFDDGSDMWVQKEWKEIDT